MNKLRLLRKQKNLSVSQLAIKVGVSGRHIAFIENGTRMPSLAIAQKIAVVLDVSIEDLKLL